MGEGEGEGRRVRWKQIRWPSCCALCCCSGLSCCRKATLPSAGEGDRGLNMPLLRDTRVVHARLCTMYYYVNQWLVVGKRVCCFVLLTQYWGIVTVPGSFLKSRDLGWPDPHPSPWLRRWLHRSPLLPLWTDLATNAVDNQGQAQAALCLGRSKVRSDTFVRCVPGSNWQTRGKPRPLTTNDRHTEDGWQTESNQRPRDRQPLAGLLGQSGNQRSAVKYEPLFVC